MSTAAPNVVWLCERQRYPNGPFSGIAYRVRASLAGGTDVVGCCADHETVTRRQQKVIRDLNDYLAKVRDAAKVVVRGLFGPPDGAA